MNTVAQESIEIGAVGRQEQECGADALDCGTHGWRLVARQIVHNDLIATREFRYKDAGHVGQERIGVHRPVEHQGAIMPVRRRPAVKVVVFQWPKGMPARSHWPRRQRP